MTEHPVRSCAHQTPKQLRAQIADLEMRLRVANEYVRTFRRDVFAGRIPIPDYDRKRAGIFAGFAADTDLKGKHGG